MQDGKIKTANEKAPLELLPMRALVGAARAFQHGACKYSPGNYMHATVADGAVGRYMGAVMRHISAMQDASGEWVYSYSNKDSESGLPEIDHVIAGLIMLRAILIGESVLPADPGISKIAKEIT